MKNIFEKFGYNLSEKQLSQFNSYYEILTEYNEKFNITAITDKEGVYVKHFSDSLLGSSLIKGKTLIDIGSGGGFPAVPLKILIPELEVTLVEATGKKCTFLTEVVKELKLSEVTVLNERAEELGKKDKYREKFDNASARAVSKLNVLSELCLPFLRIGGRFIAYKANAEEEIENSKTAIELLGGKTGNILTFDLLGENRCIIEILKVKKTPEIYPRNNNKIMKKPL